MSLGNAIRSLFLVFGSLVAANGYAFMPAPGAWSIDSEATGAPGRGLTIEVENETVIATYFGYRANGSSVFYFAVGPMVNNTFTAALNEYSGGTTLSKSYQPAIGAGSPGTITIAFLNGLKGGVTFPGESPKAISKFSFGYGNTPAGLLGTYLFAYRTSSATFTDYFTLTSVMGISSTYGNGMVSNAGRSFGCENLTSGVFAGSILCIDSTGSSYDDSYIFKMSGDRGNGVGTWIASSAYYPLQVLRTATKTGALTGINESTLAAVASSAAGEPSIAAKHVHSSQAQRQNLDYLKDLATPSPGETVVLNPEETAALSRWAFEAKMILSK